MPRRGWTNPRSASYCVRTARRNEVTSVKAFARAFVLAAVVMAPASPARAETPVVVDWDRTPPLSGTVVHSTVRVDSPSAGGTFPLAVIDHPPVDGSGYPIWGR